MYINRFIDVFEKTIAKSMFLFGPRQTGKSSLVRHSLPKEAVTFNLLDHAVFLKLSADPTLLRQQLLKNHNDAVNRLVVVDEIQKLPVLLDEVHLLIEEHGFRFILTGSSARKLRRAGVNLLGGRARNQYLHPLTFIELGSEKFDLSKALNRGLIPSHYFSDRARSDLRTYAGSYLETEIATEAAVRNIESFSRFLQVAAMCNGQILNQTTIASDAKVARKTIAEYIEILTDTLLAYELPAWNKSQKRKALETSKLYFFDVGVARAIQDLPAVKEKSADFGDAFEQYIFHELKTYIDYVNPGATLHYWRSTTGFEVDFILDNQIAIEVKAKNQVSTKDLKGLRALAEENAMKVYLVVSMESTARKTDDGILILPWREFLTSLWNDVFIKTPDEF
jgi:uncharacterized protein